MPFHAWLPNAHSAAPTHVSGLLSAIIHRNHLRPASLYGRPAVVPGSWVASDDTNAAFLATLPGLGDRFAVHDPRLRYRVITPDCLCCHTSPLDKSHPETFPGGDGAG